MEEKEHESQIEYQKPTRFTLSDAGEGLSNEEYAKRERAVVWKLDCFIAPVMMFLMLISYLDHGNYFFSRIGFAATQGLSTDIGLKRNQLNICISIFYIFYIIAEFPTSLLVKRLQYNRVIPFIAFCWGLICMCSGFVQGFPSLAVTRLLLGFFEGCLFPSMILFLCDWYKREELATRISFLFVASALSGAFGGLLAYAILYMDGVARMKGWRWLYIIEGIITLVFAGLCVFIVPKNFETAYFLTENDRVIMRHRAEATAAYSGGQSHYKWKDVKMAAKDVKSWLHGSIQICVVTILYGFGTFLPIILKDGFHYSIIQAQYLVVPGNKSMGCNCLCHRCSSIRQIQSPFPVPNHLCTLRHSRLRHFGCQQSPSSLGGRSIFRNISHFNGKLLVYRNIAWLSSNCAPDGKRAASVGILLSLINIGGVVAGQVYQTSSAPGFVLGHSWSLGCLVFAWCGWWVVLGLYKKREREKDRALAEGVTIPQDEWSDRAPDFRYQF
ncbi:high-affinity nicotinic acid transporter, putative [Talaromyces marneffei ATCC 18224]|uniref:High-affinity nicotinic acid transporter, putative n=1 Tax=Talaromyces marneffei (strain ATCC 18224 / CBS 334.59 / QM 7333) TaxID=441960 RepID=B6QIK1_TALMQ|nr:high-affinity nicotinic acid transporter, putative [Talaromyces marneffei ATCC 18224]